MGDFDETRKTRPRHVVACRRRDAVGECGRAAPVGCGPLGLRRLQDLAQRREWSLGSRMAASRVREDLSGGFGEDAGPLWSQVVHLTPPRGSIINNTW